VIHGRLLTLLDSIKKLSSSTGNIREGLNKRIVEVLSMLHEKDITDDGAWDVADALKELLPEMATKEFIYQALIEEKSRTSSAGKNWDKFFKKQDLDAYINSYEKDQDSLNSELASTQLISLYKIRNDLGRHNRAREAMRWRYLFMISNVLLAFVVIIEGLFFISSQRSSIQLVTMLVAIFAGALGAVLSRLIRLRDLDRIIDLQKNWKTAYSQGVIGATFAMIVVVVLQTSLIQFGNYNFQFVGNETITARETGLFFIVGLLSGYSEPFAFGILERLADMGSNSTEGQHPS
jgi:hypothetical protein